LSPPPTFETLVLAALASANVPLPLTNVHSPVVPTGTLAFRSTDTVPQSTEPMRMGLAAAAGEPTNTDIESKESPHAPPVMFQNSTFSPSEKPVAVVVASEALAKTTPFGPVHRPVVFPDGGLAANVTVPAPQGRTWSGPAALMTVARLVTVT
jgi:hypothetical protein